MNRHVSHDRVAAMDVARGFAVLCMVMIHVEMFLAPEGPDLISMRVVVELLGSVPAAPVFMFLMGASLAFSSHTAPGQLIRRGLLLLGAGYALNVLRLMPEAGYALAKDIPPMEVLPQMYEIDILHFAGLALVIFGIFRLTRLGRPGLLLLAAAVALCSPLLWGLHTGIPPVDMLLAPIWGKRPNTFFPLFPWLAYPLVGLAFGRTLTMAEDRTRCLFRLGMVGLAVATVTGLLLLAYPDLARSFYRPYPLLVLFIIGFVPFWTWCCGQAAPLRILRLPVRLLSEWSQGVTVFYIAHWIIIGWIAVLSFDIETRTEFLLVSAFVAAGAHCVMRAWREG